MHTLRWGLIIGITFGLLGCAGSQLTHQPDLTTSPTKVATTLSKTASPTEITVINTARSVLGTPYRYGGANTNGFDCSGLVNYAYQSVGITIPRSSKEQFRQSIRVSLHKLQAGDILFFRLNPPKISHVAIYDHDGRFIHSPSSGKQVSYASLNNPYWRKHLVAAGRF